MLYQRTADLRFVSLSFWSAGLVSSMRFEHMPETSTFTPKTTTSRNVTGLRPLRQHFQHHGTYIIVRRGAIGKGQLALEDEVHRFGRRFVSALCPNLFDLGGAELDPLPVAQFMQTVAREQNAVSRAELHNVPSIGGGHGTFPRGIHPRRAADTRLRRPAGAVASRHWRR